MLTVLVLASIARAPGLIAQAEGVPEVHVLSHTHDSVLALARARILLPDVFVIDLSAMFTPDAASVVHRARRIEPACTVVVHADGQVIGVVRPDTATDKDRGAGGRLTDTLRGLAG
ncbi:hypothetical protein GTW43_00200 [Streptomyces sp. SID5785]|uniref:hypothetical protein n=1 Tax=Streptomyces sp. SID5785 TaxID=2690309 RepID=UPI001360BC49|nr:hypothetical protein [Streptomyces sp. SID5785]MZD03509.1 hypothetical protein [Streptomyces sp. SID5785]